MSSVISNPDSVSSHWLTNILHRDSCLQQGKVINIQVTTDTSYTSTIARLNLTYSHDASPNAPKQLFLKLSRFDSKQHVIGSTQRLNEVIFHNKVALLMERPPIAHCYNAVYCEQTGSSHLLFEDLSESHVQGDPQLPPTAAQSEKTMDAFAEFHAFWWDHPSLGIFDTLPNQQTVNKYITSIRTCYPKFADTLRKLLALPQCQVYEKVINALPELWQRVIPGHNLTLIHGDANFSNVLIPRDPDIDRALIIDWQLWGISFAAEDLAHLIALYWDKEHRQHMEKKLLLRYHQGLVRFGVKNYTWHDCWTDYRLAVILRVLFMPMWFWLSGASESLWKRSLVRAMQAIEDLECREFFAGD